MEPLDDLPSNSQSIWPSVSSMTHASAPLDRETTVIRASSGGGVTVKLPVFETELYVAVIVTLVSSPTVVTSMLTVVLVAPAAMDTLDATGAVSVLLLESDTVAPPVGAAAVSVTVITIWPWLPTVEALNVTESNAAATGVGVGAGVGVGVGAGAGVGEVGDESSPLQPAAASAIATTISATNIRNLPAFVM